MKGEVGLVWFTTHIGQEVVGQHRPLVFRIFANGRQGVEQTLGDREGVGPVLGPLKRETVREKTPWASRMPSS